MIPGPISLCLRVPSTLLLAGTFFEEEDLVKATVMAQPDGRTYYYYELYAPAANGHSFTAVTAKVSSTTSSMHQPQMATRLPRSLPRSVQL